MSNHESDCQLSDSRDCPSAAEIPEVELISARTAEIGGSLPVSRVLPTRQRRLIGAWCFLDHAGPAHFGPDEGMHVGAHPHTCLQTFTWMIEGEVLHRDSLGNEQVIRPGQVNLMSAGRGIVHTEDSLPDSGVLHAAQLWIALPEALADSDPAFEHYPDLPCWEEQGCELTLLVGELLGRQSPVRVHTPLFAADLASVSACQVILPIREDFEYGLLVLEGEAWIGHENVEVNELAYLGPGHSGMQLHLSMHSRALLVGGAPFGEDILMWWNFVGHSKDYIIQAQHDWESGQARFGEVPGSDGQRLTAPKLPWKNNGPA
ncbi:pirin family protein [Pseudomonas jilinensis]|uniref:Pirin family protein n=1 Tax=Pseudomonas jilinensis TaxID=2078689 RepID=A0A396RVH1_9PSED|nr:pirin family protein [Pseudomonas jilinensis]RHW20550.1 pirin family protein [Pseudomonas jilinensis]